MTTELSVVIR